VSSIKSFVGIQLHPNWLNACNLRLPAIRACLTMCDREKLLKFKAKGREFAKHFEITRTIYSNSERSEQFMVTECFFNLFLEVSVSHI